MTFERLRNITMMLLEWKGVFIFNVSCTYLGTTLCILRHRRRLL